MTGSAVTTDCASPARRPVRWGLLAAGRIAEEFAKGVEASETGTLRAVAARSADRAREFAQRHEIERWYGGYDGLLADPEVDVVYISTPHPMHAEWAIKAAQAGKHVLCEKPLTMNRASAERVIDAARSNDVFLMEGFMYRVHPQTERLRDLVRGEIGEVQALDVALSYKLEPWDLPRMTTNALGGGAILDVGVYCTSMAMLLAGEARGIAWVEPLEVAGMACLEPVEQIDYYAIGMLEFAGGLLARVACGARLRQGNHVRIYGSAGEIELNDPCWLPNHVRESRSEIVVRNEAGERSVTIEAPRPLFAYEADHVARNLDRRESSAVTLEETLANMRTVDRWRDSAGVYYGGEPSRA